MRTWAIIDQVPNFAEQMASDCGEVMNPMASWIEIDWEKSWENLSYDYTEYDGHIFSQYY